MARTEIQNKYMNLKTFCNRLSISMPTARRIVRSGRIRFIRLNGRIFIGEIAFQDFINTLEQDDHSYWFASISEGSVSFLLKALPTAEQWQSVWDLKSQGFVREVGRMTFGPLNERMLLVEMSATTAASLDRRVFDLTPAFPHRYYIKGQFYFVRTEGGPVIPFNEASPELIKDMEAFSVCDFSDDQAKSKRKHSV